MNIYTIDDAIRDVAESLQGSQDRSATTIRCALNDALDAASKSGFQIGEDPNNDESDSGFGYDQPNAVKSVQFIIGSGNHE